MVRHFVGLQSLVYTLHQAYKDLGLILIIISVTVLMFSSLVFAFEQDSKTFLCLFNVFTQTFSFSSLSAADYEHWSFYDCIWWGLMTLTTVGYHIQPQTFLGKLSCGLCALCGVFIITLPIPIGQQRIFRGHTVENGFYTFSREQFCYLLSKQTLEE